jgi:hypothetical protein
MFYKHHTAKTKEKISKTAKEKGVGKWMIGRHAKKKTRLKMSQSHKARWPLSPFNKGYRSLHSWVARWKGKPNACEKCGKTGLKGQIIGWANIDHKYRRVLDDYIRLCAKCHGEYDVLHKLRKKRCSKSKTLSLDV